MKTYKPKGKTDVLCTCFLWCMAFAFGSKGKKDVLHKTVLLLMIVSLHISAGAQNFDSVVVVLEPPAKESEKPAFDNIGKNYIPQVYKRKINESAVQQLQQDEAFWYANKMFRKKEQKQAASSNFFSELLQEKWFKTLLWFLILACFAAVIVWYLSALNIKLFRKKSTVIKTDDTNLLPDDIFSISYEKSIAEAVQKNNFRLAVRLLYLQALALLSQKDLIQFKQDRTNSEYLAQLYATDYYNHFFKLTRSFEYTWYGQFSLSQSAFELVQKDFETFYRKLP